MLATWKDRLRLLRLLRYAGTARAVGLLAANLVLAVMPAATAWATGWLVDGATEAAAERGGLSVLAAPLAAVLGLLVLTQLAESGVEIAGFAAGRWIDGFVRQRVRRLVCRPDGIRHIEDQAVQDDVTRGADLGRRGGRQRSPGAAAVGQTLVLFRMLSAGAAAAIIATFSPVLALFVLVVSLVTRSMIRRQWMHLADLADQAVPGERRAAYWTDLITSPAAGKEIRVFGLGRWLVGLRQQAALAPLSLMWPERRAVMRRQWRVALLTFASAAAALGVPGYAAATGRIGAADLATILVAAWGVFAIGFMGHEAFDVEYGLGSVRALDRITARYGGSARPAPADGRPDGPPHVALTDLTFRYPGGTTDVLRELSLEIPPGQVLAVVGRNGAGKTTLTKLLAGLYRPSGGRIAVDGTPLDELEIESWRRRMAVLFQDFVHYPLTVRENVALAAPEAIDDIDSIRAAVAAAGAEPVVDGLPRGLDTMLWRSGSGGVELSGGQWQKISIARILFAAAHGRRLLVLDEPTAHLDVPAEARFFDTITAGARGASVILVSHRLATVRKADRIVVLSGGRVRESGSHDELLALDGEYAHLFRLQAARFSDEAVAQ